MDEALLRIAALYRFEDKIRGNEPDHRRAVRPESSKPLVDEFFTWLVWKFTNAIITRPGIPN